MRITIKLADDAYALAQTYAEARALTLDQAISELIRRASVKPMEVSKRSGVWTFNLPANAPRTTAHLVKQLLGDG